LNDRILAQLGGSWQDPPSFPSGWENTLQFADLRQHAKDLIAQVFSTSSVWGWKDPRTCLTLPFWQQVVSPMQYVICLRNPLDVAKSLQRRARFPLEKGIYLWFTYLRYPLANTIGKHRIIVFYEDLMNGCIQELRRLASFLDVPEQAERLDVQTTVRSFIDQSLQHYSSRIMAPVAEDHASPVERALHLAWQVYLGLKRQPPSPWAELDATIQEALDI